VPLRRLGIVVVVLLVTVAPTVSRAHADQASIAGIGDVDDQDEGALPAPHVVIGARVSRMAASPARRRRPARPPAELCHDRSPPSCQPGA
jgi:hypothetical protein